MGRRWGRGWTAAAVALPLAVSAAVYAHLLRGYFFADDFYNFTRIADRGCARFASEPMGGHVLLARNLVMCLHYGLFGLDARGYFAAVLATHLLNVWLLFRVIRLLSGRRAAAAIGATLWGASALHAEPLGWYAVYGHVLSATALLGALALTLPRTGHDDRHPPAGLAAICGILLLLGATCFGTGLAIAVTAPLAIMAIAPAARRGAARAALVLTSLSTPALYLGLRWLAGWIGESPQLNDVALPNAAGHLDVVLIMLVGFLRQAILGVVAGPWASRLPATDALSWGLLAAAVLVVGAAVARADAAARRAVLAMLLVSLAVYGVIALGRASFSGLWGGPGATAEVQRYHYAGSAALTICLTTALAALAHGRPAAWLGAALGGLVLVNVWGLYRHPVAIDSRERVRRVVASQLARVQAATSQASPGRTVYLENQPLPLGTAGVFAHQLLPGTAALALITSRSDRWQGRELRFWDADTAARRAFQPPTSRWLSRMLVAPHVQLEPARAACELRAAKLALALVRQLLRCEREAVSGRADATPCQDSAQAAYDRAAVTCATCLDPRAFGQRLRSRIEATRWWFRCMPNATAAPPPVRCSDAALAAAARLIDGLFACHRRSILRDRRLDDTQCEDRVTDAYRARVAALGGECGQCFEVALGPAVQWQVGLVFADVFCGSLGPPVHDGSARSAP